MINYKDFIKKIEPEMEKAYNFFEEEIKKIRTARATPSLIENIPVEYLGSKLTIKQLAAITIANPRELLVQPWDRESAYSIEKALESSNLGLRVSIDKEAIKVSLPELTRENKENLIKLIHQKAEETRKRIRYLREEVWGEIQEKTREGEIREDDKFRAKDELQKLIDEYNKKIKELVEKKEKEILT
jgi:ribosome recycling factor